MLELKISTTYYFIISKIETFVSKKNWAIYLSVACCVSVLFFSFPSYTSIQTDKVTIENWDAVFKQIEHPFENHNYDPISHQSKLTFRLTMSLIAKALHLHLFGILVLQGIIGFFLFLFSAKTVERITQDKVSAVFLTLSLAFIYPGKVAFLEVRGIFDGLALFLLIFSIYKQNPLFIFTSVFLAAFTDERGLIASSFVFLFWYINTSTTKKSMLSRNSIAVILAMIAYFGTRLFLTHHFQLKTLTGGIGLQVLASNLNLLPLGIWHGLEGNWLLVILTLMGLFTENKLNFILFLGALTAVILSSSLVADVSRSAAYALPALFVSILILKKTESNTFIRKVLVVSMLLSFIYPAYFSGSGYYIEWTLPMPLRYVFTYFTSS